MKSSKTFSDFDLISVKIMSHLYKKDSIDEEIINLLRELNLIQSLVNEKVHLLEERINIDNAFAGICKLMINVLLMYFIIVIIVIIIFNHFFILFLLHTETNL